MSESRYTTVTITKMNALKATLRLAAILEQSIKSAVVGLDIKRAHKAVLPITIKRQEEQTAIFEDFGGSFSEDGMSIDWENEAGVDALEVMNSETVDISVIVLDLQKLDDLGVEITPNGIDDLLEAGLIKR